MLRLAFAAALVLVVALPLRARSAPAPVPFPEYQSLLDQYGSRFGGEKDPLDTRFDYEQLYVDEHIRTVRRSERLERVHAELFAVTPAALARRARIAWALDAANFLVIERITLNLLMPTAKKIVRWNSVDELDHGPERFYLQPTVQVEGRRLSIQQFVRRYLYGDTVAIGFRQVRGDPRLALAFCGGRVGSPPLALREYRGDSLDVQLDAAARTALALPRFLAVDAAKHKLELSMYLQQQHADFGASLDASVPFLLQYAPRAQREAIRNAKLTHVTGLIPVAPELNQRPHPQNPDRAD